MLKRLLLLIFLFLSGCFWLAPAKAAGTYYYDNIEVQINVKQDSSFDVTEKQTYNLTGSFGYFFRDIELKDLDHISNIKVLDSNGNVVSDPNISYKGNQLHIQWNFPRRDFNNELKFWTVEYTVYGGLRFFKDYDELYWNAIFQDRDVNVNNAKVIIHLPKETSFQALSYIGKPGNDRKNYNYDKIDDKTIEFAEKNIAPE